MAAEEESSLSEGGGRSTGRPLLGRRITRRQALRYGVAGTAGLVAGGYLVHYLFRSARWEAGATVFRNDAPRGELWAAWKRRGWVREASHYRKLGSNVQCKVCPNNCLLEPEDRGRCRNKVNKDGVLYTLAYGDPCTAGPDPVEKKPLFHFLPGERTFSLATSGCGFRCLNCQNWEISQRKPEETKDPRGAAFRLRPETLEQMGPQHEYRWSMFPADVVAMAKHGKCTSVAYTYSEPTAFYEYMYDTARLARRAGLRNIWVTCGYINHEALTDLCQYLDAANVDLKSFSDDIYRRLNSGRLQPILDTLLTLKDLGVWFEVTNLVVPTYTDDLDMIARMCDWLVENLGRDYPLHFSRFTPKHKLVHLPFTSPDVLLKARDVAREAGLRHVYIGNVHDLMARVPALADCGTTYCPACGKAVVRREGFAVRSLDVRDGKCGFCAAALAGVWSAPGRDLPEGTTRPGY
jgi:pyruvate formate lyase activating enzyme